MKSTRSAKDMTRTEQTEPTVYKPVKLSEHSYLAALNWITSNDTGVSSKAIWAIMMTGKPPSGNSAPADSSDFGRCYRLLKMIPEFEESLDRMRSIENDTHINGYPDVPGGWREKNTWSVFVDNYPKLCELYKHCLDTGDGNPFYTFWNKAKRSDNLKCNH
jgi:hypothetical protein